MDNLESGDAGDAGGELGGPMDDDEANGDDDGDDGAPAAAAGKGAPAVTKSELFAAYKKKGPHAMYKDIMSDPDLRCSAEILVQVTRPLHEQYKHDLLQQKPGDGSRLTWSARRSLGSTNITSIKIFNSQFSRKLTDAMRIPRCNPPVEFDEVAFAEDLQLLKKARSFATHLAANYSWSEFLHEMTFPFAANGLLAEDLSSRKKCMRHCRKLVNAISKAEDMVASGNHPTLESCLTDLAFQEETLAREVMILLKRGGFDLDSGDTQEVVVALRKFMSGSSSTKEILESTFAHLHYVTAASNKNKKMHPALLWFYCTTSPYVTASGMPQHIPSQTEWVEWNDSFGDRKVEFVNQFNKAFLAAKTPLPTDPGMEIPRTPGGIAKSKWRLSGPASHYKSSAAAAYLLFDAEHDFESCSDAWTGLACLGNNQLGPYKINSQNLIPARKSRHITPN